MNIDHIPPHELRAVLEVAINALEDLHRTGTSAVPPSVAHIEAAIVVQLGRYRAHELGAVRQPLALVTA